MPITLTAPVPPGLGPGVYISASSDFIGPLPSTAFWQMEIFVSGTENRVHGEAALTQATGISTPIGVYVPPWHALQPTIVVPDDTEVTLVLSLHENQTIVLDQTSFPNMRWRSTSAISELLDARAGLTTGGFTAEDRANLTDVEEATTTLQTSQVNPAIRVALGVADLALNFPVNRLAALECQAYTGRGSLTRPGGGFPVNAFGIRWNIVLVPESFGRRDGAILEYIERVAQLVKINHDTNGNLYVDDVEDIFHTGGTMAWSWNNLPAEVQYDVTPGCQVEFCWLLL